MHRTFTLTALAAVVVAAAATTAALLPRQQPPPGDLERLKQQQAAKSAFNTLTPAQMAAAWKRRVQWCLDNLSLTDEQRAIVRENLDAIRPENYRQTLEEQQEVLKRLKPLHDRTRQVLGRELYLEIFYRGPSLEDIDAVRKHPSIR